MKSARPHLQPLGAFASTVALVLAYLVAVLTLSPSNKSPALSAAGTMHVLLFLLPPFASGFFYSFVTRDTDVSSKKRVLQVATAAILAPVTALSLVAILWLAFFGGTM